MLADMEILKTSPDGKVDGIAFTVTDSRGNVVGSGVTDQNGRLVVPGLTKGSGVYGRGNRAGRVRLRQSRADRYHPCGNQYRHL